jgi:transposase InsO family protein
MVKSLIVNGRELGPRKVQVLQTLPLGVEVIVGLDVVQEHGLTVAAGKEGKVTFGCVAGQLNNNSGLVGGYEKELNKTDTIEIVDTDFDAKYEQGIWTVNWKWKDDGPPAFCSRPNYAVPPADQDKFDEEIRTWVEEGILVPWKEREHGSIKNIVPLMSVHQAKGEDHKIRPVLDFKKMNGSVLSRPGEIPVCDKRLREWRKMGPDCSIVDLKRAYLQIYVSKDLWVYQAVRWKGQLYLLTRLGFGLNVAPKVMTAIVHKVLSLDEKIDNSTSSFIDDIFAGGGEAGASGVRDHLSRYGLVTKEAEKLGCAGGVRVLGLRVGKGFRWSRDSRLPSLSPGRLTRRELHSWIGELLGHFPVAGWLRVMCGYLQRCTAGERIGWDDPVGDGTREKVADLEAMLQEKGDPVQGRWLVDANGAAVLWADASNLALGVSLEVNGAVVEDCAWLRKDDDSAHINMSELDAVIRGVNLCLRWDIRHFTVKTDSATAFGWLQSVFEKTHRVRTHALSEMLIRRRLDILSELTKQEGLDVTVELVPSAQNKADELTRVPKKWLTAQVTSIGAAALAAVGGRPQTAAATTDDVKCIHDRNHFGVDRTLELARKKFGQTVPRQMAKNVVAECRQCASIDPAVTFRWQKGKITHGKVWQQLSMDVTHVNGRAYLSCIDCASGFTIWRSLRDETTKEVCLHLRRMFAEMGPPETLLSDNAAGFRSVELQQLLDAWKVTSDFSCTYRAQGNGVIERVHRTIKRMVARSGRSVEEMCFWYNVTKGEHPASPYEMVFGATPRMPGVSEKRQEVERTWPVPPHIESEDTRVHLDNNPFTVGDQVFMKRSSRCDQPWSGPHRVTSITSSVGAVVDNDGYPRHVSHLRRVPPERTGDGQRADHLDEVVFSDGSDIENEPVEPLQRDDATDGVAGGSRQASTRTKVPPQRWADSYADYYDA